MGVAHRDRKAPSRETMGQALNLARRLTLALRGVFHLGWASRSGKAFFAFLSLPGDADVNSIVGHEGFSEWHSVSAYPVVAVREKMLRSALSEFPRTQR